MRNDRTIRPVSGLKRKPWTLFLLHPWWDASPLRGYPNISGWRSTEALWDQEHRAMSPGRGWTRIARGERTMERAIQELISKYHTLLPSIFMTGVHAPSPHPKSPMWHRTVTGFELKWSKTSRLAFSLLNIKNLLEPEMVRTVVAMNCFHFFLT